MSPFPGKNSMKIMVSHGVQPFNSSDFYVAEIGIKLRLILISRETNYTSAQHEGCPPVMVLQFPVLGITDPAEAAKPAHRCWRQAAEFAQQTFRDFLSSN